MITVILPLFSTLLISNLAGMILVIKTIRATTLKIAIIITTMAVSYKKKSIIFVAKKVITLINIQTMSNGRQKNFGDETKNFVEIKVNITHFSLIIKGI